MKRLESNLDYFPGLNILAGDLIEEIRKLSILLSRSEYSSWGSDECNSISGGEGSQFPPSIKPETRLGIFIPDICR